MKKNDYSENSDEELALRAQTGDKDVENFLLEKYKNFVIGRTKGYYLNGGERQDLIQEGMIGLHNAIQGFKKDREIPFRNFASLCIKRSLITALRVDNRKKNSFLNKADSFSKDSDSDYDVNLLEMIASVDSLSNPEEAFLGKEMVESLENEIFKALSVKEHKVLDLIVKGYSVPEMVVILDTNPKSLYNTIDRVRKKVKKVIDNKY